MRDLAVAHSCVECGSGFSTLGGINLASTQVSLKIARQMIRRRYSDTNRVLHVDVTLLMSRIED